MESEFTNRVMSEFCEKKGIKREFSVARTPQQNGVAERRNRTLIEAARTMLADSSTYYHFGLKQLILLAICRICNGAGHSSKEPGSSQDYILMPLWKDGGINDQERTENSAQDVNTAGLSINTVSTNFNASSLNINTVSQTVPTALLESTYADSFGDESKLDLSNIATTYPVPSTPNTRIHKDYSLDHMIGDIVTSENFRIFE
ncbi:putative ribonuclease H-like domain-containing protein [Tanacetum coccineum]